MEYTEDEKRAVNYFKVLFNEGQTVPCDTDLSNFKPELPPWFDAEKYKRGQQYFLNNRTPIFTTNLVGLIALLAHNNGLQILMATGRSGTPETARKRYVSTILHTLCWYEVELYPGSKSWESLMRVRKMHLNSSRLAQEKKLHFITQSELTITQFGFMGLALVRPGFFGIHHDNEEDIKAFVHVWAVIGYMLGIHDKFNMCLQPFETVKIICQIHLRYLMLPALQLECPNFKQMTKALLKGLSQFLPFASYDRYMFFARQSVGVPGYQYKVDLEKEVHCRSVFTPEDIKLFYDKYAQMLGYNYVQFVLFTDIPVFNITKHFESYEINGNDISYSGAEKKNEIIVKGKATSMDPEYAEKLRKYLGIDDKDSISLSLINYETEYSSCLNDSKFNELNSAGRRGVQFSHMLSNLLSYRLGRYFVELLTNIMLFRMRYFLDNAKQSN